MRALQWVAFIAAFGALHYYPIPVPQFGITNIWIPLFYIAGGMVVMPWIMAGYSRSKGASWPRHQQPATMDFDDPETM